MSNPAIRLRQIAEEIKALINEGEQLVESTGNKFAAALYHAYPYGNIMCCLSHETGYLNKYDTTIYDIAKKIDTGDKE